MLEHDPVIAAGQGPRAGAAVATAMVLAAAWLGAAVPAAAGANRWTQIGPPGGSFALAVGQSAPLTVYAVAQPGAVYRSLDGGGSWELAGTIPHPGSAGQLQFLSYTRYSLTVDPTDGSTVYACTLDGLYKTVDGGATWEPLGNVGVFHVAVAPSAPQTLYGLAGIDAIARSDDGGVTWRALTDLPSMTIPSTTTSFASDLVIDPADANTAYALTTQGIAKTSDGGNHWTEELAVVLDAPSRIALDPRHPSTLYLATAQFFHPDVARVWRSNDSGVTWSPAGTGLPEQVNDLVVAPSGTVYAASPTHGGSQMFRSTDGAASWQLAATLAADQVLNLAADPGGPDRLYAADAPGGTGGILLSLDQGRIWSAPAQPPSGQVVSQLLSSPAGGGLYVEATPWLDSPHEFLHSNDGGATWSALAATGQQPWLGVPRLVLDAQPGVLYAAGQGVGENNLASSDDGASWRALPLPAIPGSNLLDLAADPLHPGKLDLLSFNPSASAVQPAVTRLLLNHSDTGGQSWSLVSRLAVPGALAPRGVLELDRLPIPGPPGLLRLDPVQPATAYVLAGGLYRSTAAEPALTRLGLVGPVIDLAIDPSAPTTLYAAVARPKVLWKSTDGGATWAAASNGLPRQAGPVALAIDPLSPSTLYLAAADGVFVTDDAARTWRPLDTGFAGQTVSALAVSTTHPHTVWAATLGAGVFALTRRPPP